MKQMDAMTTATNALPAATAKGLRWPRSEDVHMGTGGRGGKADKGGGGSHDGKGGGKTTSNEPEQGMATLPNGARIPL